MYLVEKEVIANVKFEMYMYMKKKKYKKKSKKYLITYIILTVINIMKMV